MYIMYIRDVLEVKNGTFEDIKDVFRRSLSIQKKWYDYYNDGQTITNYEVAEQRLNKVSTVEELKDWLDEIKENAVDISIDTSEIIIEQSKKSMDKSNIKQN